jgi:hypothetical protein
MMINFPILINKIDNHNLLKKDLLNLINKEKTNSLQKIDNYYTDDIIRLDWNKKTDWSRKWVVFIKKSLENHFEKVFNKIGLKDVEICALWFQQYIKNNTHGWHVHGDNFTGVYYVEFNKNLPKTEIVYPLTNNLIPISVEEGDILIFPSFLIHRSPPVKTEDVKTIISFNISLKNIEDSFLKKLKDTYEY